MSRYPDPRRVTITLADTRRLTILERARSCALAGIGESEIKPLLRAVATGKGEARALETGATLLYALAYQLERRLDPSITWEEAQSWDLALDLESAPDPIAEAEALASVQAAIGTGLPPAIAGELTLAQLEAYSDARADAAGKRRTRRARRAVRP